MTGQAQGIPLIPGGHTSAIALILLAAVFCYGNTFGVPFVLDDVTSVLGNPLVKSFHFSLRSRIVGDASFALDYALHGLSLFGYHLTNLLIHCGVGCLVYLFTSLLLRTPLFAPEEGAASRQEWRFVPLFTALLFVVHPIQTQAVTYIAQRVTSLAAFFYLAALCSYLLARRATAAGPRLAWFGAAFLTALLAMLTKENAATLPFALLLCELVFFPGRGLRRFVPALGFFVVALVVPLSLFAMRGSGGTLTATLARLTADAPAIPRLTYLATQCRVVATYLRLLILPVGQNLDYDYPLANSFLSGPVLAALALHLCLLGGSVALLIRTRRQGVKFRLPLRLAAFGVCWFYLALSVESTIIPIRDVIFEHRVYLPSVGFFLALAALLVMGREWLARVRPTLVRGAAVAVWLLVPILATATVFRNTVWGDEQRLWEDVIHKSPGKARGHGSLAAVLQRRGETGAAIEEYRQALADDPRDVAANNNLAAIYLGQQRYTSARILLTRALAQNPANAKAHYNLGNVYLQLGALADAKREYGEALRIEPEYDQVYNNLGLAYAKGGDYKGALSQFRRAVELNPENREAADNLRKLQAAGFK